MKTLTELSMELSLGLTVYHNRDVNLCVYLDTRLVHDMTITNFVFSFVPNGHIKSVSGRELELLSDRPVCTEIGYEPLDELIADWPIAREPVWITTKTPERLDYEARLREAIENRPVDDDHPF